MVHTHTLPQEGGKLRSRQWDENEEEGKWRWGEDDDNEMKVTQPGRKEGNAKEEGKREHQHMKPSPQRATLERQGKRKAEADGNRNKTSGGGGRQKRLNLTRRKPTSTSARKGPNLPGERRTQEHMKKGTHGELANEMMHPQWHAVIVIRLQGPRFSFQPHLRLSVFNPWITCTIEPHQKPTKEKEPHLKNEPAWTEKKMRPVTAASCFNTSTSTGETWKKADSFTLLRRITNSKVSIQTQKKGKPGTAASCSTHRHRQVRNEKRPAVHFT